MANKATTSKRLKMVQFMDQNPEFVINWLIDRGLNPDNFPNHDVKVKMEYPVPTVTIRKKTRIVKNLMTGKMVEIPADTPISCDPSSETYWQM
jgi:hypothetical protein